MPVGNVTQVPLHEGTLVRKLVKKTLGRFSYLNMNTWQLVTFQSS